MWNRGGIRSSALERAKAQLSGQRITNGGTSQEAQGRDAPSHGKTLQSRQIPFHGLSDFSSDTEREIQDYRSAHPVKTVPRIAETAEHFDMGGGRRFLKKSVNKLSSPADTSEVMYIPQRGSQNVALSKLAQIETRIRNQTKLSLDTSADLKSSLPVKSSSELSAAGRSRLFNTEVSTPNSQESVRPPADIYMASECLAPDIQKGLSMDSDEEEMRILLGELFDSPDGVKATRQKDMSPQQAGEAYKNSSGDIMLTAEQKGKEPVHSTFTEKHQTRLSPSPPRSVSTSSRPFVQKTGHSSSLSSALDHSEIKSLEELFPIASDHNQTQSERSVLSDDFKINVMSLDDLAPDTLNITKYDTNAKQPGVSSAGEILQKPEDEVNCYESDFESEIETETAQSMDNISEHLSVGNEHSFKAWEPQSESLSAKLNSVKNALSENPSKSASTLDSRSQSSSQSSDTSSHSSDPTSTPTSPSRTSRSQHRKDVTVQTQTAGLAYLYTSDQTILGPSVGMSFVDPTPIASHVISAEAVEALTAYTPSMFALNDMLRQQLTLTRNFIQSSRQLHQTMLETLGPPDYKYTTLEDTKEFIRCNRPSKLTVEEALEEVLQEMRDYHYI